MSNTKSELRLAKIEQAENRLKARKQKLINSMKSDKRKQDTRMKILLGAIDLKLAAENERSRQRVKKIVAMLNERDQKTFDDLFATWSNQP